MTTRDGWQRQEEEEEEREDLNKVEEEEEFPLRGFKVFFVVSAA